MKYIIVIILSLPFTQSFSAELVRFDDGTELQCSSVAPPRPLRYQYQYGFFDIYQNQSADQVYLHTFEVRYKDSKYLSQGERYPDGKLFAWTKELVDNGYKIQAHSSIKHISTYKSDWAVLNHPVSRRDAARLEYDFMVAYKYTYDFNNNEKDVSSHKQFVTCQPYYITWLGDGVVDSKYEKCDPLDKEKTSWGRRGCDASNGLPID